MVKYLSEFGGVMLTSVVFSASVQATEVQSPSTQADTTQFLLSEQSLAQHPLAQQSAMKDTSTVLQAVTQVQPLVALQSGAISDINTFGVLPQDGDVLDAGSFTITVDQSFIAGLATTAPGDYALKGEFVVESGVILTVNGDWDASQSTTQNVLNGNGQILFDGGTGVARRYIAASGYYRAPSLLVASTKADKAFFGLKPGALGSFAYDKQGFLGSNIQGGNVHLNGFSTGYIHDGYNTAATQDCIMPNVLFTNSGRFLLRYFALQNGSCDLQNLTMLSPTVPTAFATGGIAGQGAQSELFNLNGLSVDGGVEYYSRPEFLMNDWVVKDFLATLPEQGWQDIDSWLLFNANAIPVGSASTSNIYFRAEKYNPYGFGLNAGVMTGRSLREIDSVVFDFVNLEGIEPGDMYLFGGPGETGETVRITNNIGLKNLNGQQASTFMTFNGSNQDGRSVEANNNVVFVPFNNRSIALNGASLTPAGTVTSVKDNIFWGDATQPGFVIDALGTTSATDIVTSGAYANNGVFNGRTDGNHGELDLPLSYTPDLPVTTNAPQFHDDTRRLDTYGASQLGLQGGEEATFNAFVTRHLSTKDMERLDTMGGHDQLVSTHKGALAVKDLVDWVKQGFVATNTTYHTSASDSGALGLSVTADFAFSDSDGDTVDDAFDKCANTPVGGVIADNGCTDTQIPQKHLVALQSGPISDPDTFGEVLRDGDTIDAGAFTITIDQNFTAGLLHSPAGSVALKGEFEVAAGVSLTVNGDWDASQSTTQNVMRTGAHIEFDGNANITRRYIAAGNYYYAASVMVDSTIQDKAFFGLKPGSTAKFTYDKQGFLGSNIRGGNVHLNGFSTGYIHDGYDRATTKDCEMPNVLFTNSGEFHVRYSAGENGSCDLRNLTILSSTAATAFKTVGTYADATRNDSFNLNGLSVDGSVDYYARGEFQMDDWVVKKLLASLPDIGWRDIDSWLLFDANSIPVGSAKTSNVYFRNDKSNPHGYGMGSVHMTGMAVREIDSVVFDFVNQDVTESGDLYLFNRPAGTNETVRITNNIALKNLNGNQSSTFIAFNGDDQAGRQVEVSNNVVYIPDNNRALSLNEASSTPANILSKVNDNIFWGDAAAPGYVVDSLGNSSQTDILTSGAYVNNGVVNARKDGQFGELDLPLSYTPNAPVTTDSPQFYDDTRRLGTYGKKVLGLDGTADTAFNAFVTRHLTVNDMEQLTLLGGHEALVEAHQGVLAIKDMIDWIKQGFVATRTTYHDSGTNASSLGLQVTSTYTLVDSDGDTVDDMFEVAGCENTPVGESVDEFGCSASQYDDDNDGIDNSLDICVETATGSTVNASGCSDDEIEGKLIGFTSWGIGGGGAMAGYSINPHEPTMRFVGTDMGTAFRSLNEGKNWAPIRHTQTTYHYNLGYAAPFGFASKHTVLHAPQGLNPVRSIDAGQTFAAPESFAVVYSDDSDATNDERIIGWYSDMQNAGTVYAMTNLGLWRSTDDGSNWSFVYSGGEIKGMFIDEHDSGKVYIATENEVLSSADGVTYVNYFTPTGHKIHRFAGGSNATDKTLTYASDETAVAIAAGTAAGLVAGGVADVKATYSKPSNAGDEVSAAMIYVSKNAAAFAQTSQFMGAHLSMAQNDPQTIYATGSRNWGRDKGTSVYVSSDAGDSWTVKLLQYDWDAGYTAYSGVDMEHSPVGLNVGWYDGGYYTASVNQTDSSQFGGSGNFFLYATKDTGSKWEDLTNEYKGTTPTSPVKSDEWASSGLNVTSVYDLKFNPYSTDDIYAAYADIHGARSTDHGQTWTILPSTANSIYDYAFADANTVFMVNGSQHDWPYLSLTLKGVGGVFKSTNKGDTWTRLTEANTTTVESEFDRQYLSVAYDGPNNTIYAGSQQKGVLRSTDDGANWAWFNAGLPTKLDGHDYDLELVIPQIEVMSNGNVYALVTGVRPQLTAAQVADFGLQSNEYIADTSEGTTKYFSWINADKTGIYFLDVQNGSQTWQLLRGTIDTNTLGNWNSDHQPWRRPMSFAVDPNNTNVLWMTDMEGRTWQQGAAGVWKSIDHGTTWKLMQKHTFALDINIAPGDSNYVAVAGPQSWGAGGMHITKDGGVTWTEDERPQLQNNGHSVCFDPVNTNKIIYGYSGGGMLFGDKL